MSHSTREGLEDALVADPDNLILHSAYADLLMEEGDPRGEYIQLRLALEDRSTPVEVARRQATEARRLFQEHHREWLGPLAEHQQNIDIVWRRGWIERVEFRDMTRAMAYAWLECPVYSMVREIVIDRADGHGNWMDGGKDIHAMAAWLEWHATNSAAQYLMFRGTHIRDSGIEGIIRSKIIDRLDYLYLGDCWLTDYQAELLANVPGISRLVHLHISGTYLSYTGIEMLMSAGVPLAWEDYLPLQRYIPC